MKPLSRLDETALQQSAGIGSRLFDIGNEEMMIIRRDWTPREHAILEQGALTGQTVGEIARQVGRTMSAVLTRARTHQIKLRRSRSKDVGLPQTA